METSTPSVPLTLGVHHVGLSVADLKASIEFFTSVLAYKRLGEKPDYPAAFVTDGHTMITLWQVKDPQAYTPFDRHENIGLHHLALHVPDIEALDILYARFLEHNIDMEFAPEPRADGKARHMMCNIPGGPRLEFVTMTV